MEFTFYWSLIWDEHWSKWWKIKNTYMKTDLLKVLYIYIYIYSIPVGHHIRVDLQRYIYSHVQYLWYNLRGECKKVLNAIGYNRSTWNSFAFTSCISLKLILTQASFNYNGTIFRWLHHMNKNNTNIWNIY